MRTISSKISCLIISILFIFGGFWIVFQQFHQQTMEQYNMVLERYLTIKRVSVLSEQLLLDTHQYFQSNLPSQKRDYEETKTNAQRVLDQVKQLKNKNNESLIYDYVNQIDSEIEALDLAIQAHEMDRADDANRYYEQATETRSFIAETTLSLIQQELKVHEQTYIQMIDFSHRLEQLGIETFLIIFVVLIAFSYDFSKRVTRSITELTKGARAIASGHYDLPVQIESNDEIAFLAKTFETMRLNIKKSFEEIAIKTKLEKELQDYQLLIKEMELKSLQNQMKPHFLFNTLNTLAKKAYLEQAYETSDLIVTVADVLRYQLRKANQTVQLAEEVEMIRNYMSILKARFTSRLHFKDDIDQRLLDIFIPSFILQPIIENAFIHGIEPKEEGGTIRLAIYEQDSFVQIEIVDDGKGMSEEEISQLLSSQPRANNGTNIGFQNVKRRLEWFYQMEHLLEVKSQLEQGTQVIIKVPKQPIKEVVT